MNDYNQLREFADSYGLGAMVVIFVAFILWALRPGSRRHYHEAAVMIFDEDEQGAIPQTGTTSKDKSHG